MLKAYNQSTNELVLATRDMRFATGNYVCPCCGRPVVNIPATAVRPYFKHREGQVGCTYSTYSNSSNCVSEWHKKWIDLFESQYREQLIKRDNHSVIADICIGKLVIEFQHTYITDEDFAKRTEYYINNGYGVVWVFDFSAIYKRDKLKLFSFVTTSGTVGKQWFWVSPLKTFSAYYDLWRKYNNKFAVYIDISGITEDNSFDTQALIYKMAESKPIPYSFFTMAAISRAGFVQACQAKGFTQVKTLKYLGAIDVLYSFNKENTDCGIVTKVQRDSGEYNGAVYDNYIISIQRYDGTVINAILHARYVVKPLIIDYIKDSKIYSFKAIEDIERCIGEYCNYTTEFRYGKLYLNRLTILRG